MNRFLFELGTEEIPADMIAPAMKQLEDLFQALLRDSRLEGTTMHPYSSPRRLALIVDGLPDRQPDRQEIVSGPPVSVALDPEGKPTAAAAGFARRQGVSVDQLEVIETEKGSHLGLRRQNPGRPAVEILADSLGRVIAGLSWPRSMYWRESRFRFVRPIRWLVALWNESVVPFEFEGIVSGRSTRGHRFLGGREVLLASAGDYVDELRRQFVLVDVAQRRSRIEKGLNEALRTGETVRADETLLELVTHLNEFPSVLRGSFDQAFLAIPQEVLVTVMRHHQKYFSVVDSEGQLCPCFLTVVNHRGDPDGTIRHGHEKVLKARLEDASFFWRTDRKTPLEERVDQLRNVLFQEKLGTYWDKCIRLQNLVKRIAPGVELELAARLCKADLTTGMVRELTELQGVMGGLYARDEGLPEDTWKAIYEHYRPLSMEDRLPSTRMGALLSIIDKLDSVVGCLGIGIAPRGSSDPFALRRQAQGMVRVLLEWEFDLPLPAIVAEAWKEFSFSASSPAVPREVMEFLGQRVRYVLQSRGIAYDVLNAVLAVPLLTVHDAFRRAEALARIRQEADFEALAVAFKRIRNILEKQAEPLGEVRLERLVEAEEHQLYQAFSNLRPRVEGMLKSSEYEPALREIAGLRSAVDRFFDKVLVMTDDSQLRSNRLALLHELSAFFLQVADFSEIVQQGEQDDRKRS